MPAEAQLRRASAARRWWPLAALILLAGCHAGHHHGATPPVAAVPASEVKATEATPIPTVPQTVAPPLGAQEPPPETPPEAVAALPPVEEIEPDSLMGLVGMELEGRLGAPFMVRRETPAEIWQYRGESCVFDVFLYPQAGTNRVVYMEARDRAAQKISKQGCLSEILRDRAAVPTG